MNYTYLIPEHGDDPTPLCWRHATAAGMNEGNQIAESISACRVCGEIDQELPVEFDLATWMGLPIPATVEVTQAEASEVTLPADPITYPSPENAKAFYRQVVAGIMKSIPEQPNECDEVTQAVTAFFYLLYPDVAQTNEHRFTSADTMILSMLDLHALGHIIYRLGFDRGQENKSE